MPGGRLASAVALSVALLVNGAVSASSQSAERPNLVLVTVEGLRADRLGCAGWGGARTRTLDRLAADGVRFAACDTASPSTRPSLATILTGQFPPRHGVRDDGDVLASEVATVAERLAAVGYATAAVVGTSTLRRNSGLLRGFGVWDDNVPRGGSWPAPPGVRSAEEVSGRAADILDELQTPTFLWVHFADLAARPVDATAGGRDVGPTPGYDAVLADVDGEIARVLRATDGPTAVIVVGSQGEMLGEHGEQGHGLLPLRGARRVPLLLAGPGLPEGQVERCLVRTADVAATLLTLAGAAPLAGVDGDTLLPLPSQFGRCGRRSFCEAAAPYAAYGWFPLQVVGDYRWTYAQGPRHGILVDARDDEFERNDLASAEPLEPGRWLGRLSRTMAGAALTGLPSSLPDPRLQVAVHATVRQAADLALEGSCEQALIMLAELADPAGTNAPALAVAGSCRLRLDQADMALPLLSRAVELRGDDPVAVADLGACLLRLGRVDEAESTLRRAVALDPADGVSAAGLAAMLRRRGELDAALIVLDEADSRGAHDAVLYLERGRLQSARGELNAALEDFLGAAALRPDDLVPVEHAARTAVAVGRFDQAADLYERLLDLAPERGEVWQALGSIYLERLGRRQAALRCFREALRLATDEAQRRALIEVVEKLSR